MAELPTAGAAGTGRRRHLHGRHGLARPGRPVGMVHAYLLLVAMWTRAAVQYPASLLMLSLAQLAATGMDFAVVVIVFSHVRTLAGFALPEVMFLYGASATALALADLVVGNIDLLGRHVRAGTFDVMLVRPAGALAQLAAEQFSPRRFGKLGTSVPVLAVAVAGLHVHWTVGRVLAVPAMVCCGTVIFAAVWTIVTAAQFVVVEAVELVGGVVYGGGQLTQYPLTVYGRQAVLTLTFVAPLAFVNWQPALYVLDRPDPFGLPHTLRFASPVVAFTLALLAAAAWRAGMRHYRSTGS